MSYEEIRIPEELGEPILEILGLSLPSPAIIGVEAVIEDNFQNHGVALEPDPG